MIHYWLRDRQNAYIAGSASIPEALISYQYRIVLVSIARIDIESIRYRFLTAFISYFFNSSFLTFLYNDSIKIYP
jgi:hypothetical protein